MINSLFILIILRRMDRGIVWTMWLIDHFSLFFFSLLIWLHHRETGNSAGGIWRSYTPTSPIHQFRHVGHQYYIFYSHFPWRNGRPFCSFNSGSRRCGSHTNNVWFTSTCTSVFCILVHWQEITPIRVYAISPTVSWHWSLIFTLYII